MKIYRMILMVVAFCLLCTSVVTLSMGWLTNVKNTNTAFPFTAGQAQSYNLYQVYYNNADAESNPGQRNVASIENLGTGLNNQNQLVLNFNNLQLGNIYNLHILQNENYVYYVVEIPKSMGGTVDLGITYGDIDNDGDHFTIYTINANNEKVEYTNTTRLAEINKIETEQADTFLSYSFALSEKAPTHTDLASIDGMNALFNGTTPAALNNVDGSGNPVTSEKTFNTSSLTGDCYYLYIKLQPNITLYKYFIDYLYDAMPFYLAYEVRVVLSVTPTTTA